MSDKLKLKDDKRVLEITHDYGTELRITSAGILELIRFLDKFQLAAGITTFEVEQDGENPQAFSYTFSDGERDWNQTIHVDQMDPLMDYDVSDQWRESELLPHRQLRLHVVSLIPTYLISKIECTWSE
jgi:hypothetical protein